MLETTILLLKENQRNLFQKIKGAPILYFFFSAMMIFSVIMFGFLTLFLLRTEYEFSFFDVFFSLFFLFLLKSAADVHNLFIKSSQLSYALSTQVSHQKIIAHVFFSQFLINMGLWFFFSTLYILSIFVLNIAVNYPLEYLFITIGMAIALLVGPVLALFFFSSNRFRLVPSLLLLGFYWYSHEVVYVVCTLPLACLHLFWGIHHGMESFLFVKRKERVKERRTVRSQNILSALATREILTLWRDRLFFSFVFTAITTALFTGYFFLYGADILIPESIRSLAEQYLPSMFVFLGIYIVVIYTAVFPSLNLFLNEEKTMWILHHLPLPKYTIVVGKTLALLLCFITTIPFIAYISIFIGLQQLPFLIWVLMFSFLAGVIISLPLGAKYVGKKSDILLFYAVAMILFIVAGIAASAGKYLTRVTIYWPLFLCSILLVELLFLWLSALLSAKILKSNVLQI